MARVLITGSSDGLGLLVGQLLASQHHEVVAHARSESRAADTVRDFPKAPAVVIGDLSTLAGMREVARSANATGRFDAVIHNAAVGSSERHVVTPDGLCHVFAINVLAPYLLTALIETPGRLVYMSSGMHQRWHAEPRRPPVGEASLERVPGLLRLQAVCRRPCCRRRPAPPRRLLERRRPGLGGYQDGGRRCPRRHGDGS